MTQIIKKEIGYMWLPACVLTVIWLSCAHVKKSMQRYETHVDSLRSEKYANTAVQKKDSTAMYKTSVMQSQQAFRSDNLVVRFAADTVKYTAPVQIWTDSAGRVNINSGGRSLSSVTQKKAQTENNVNTEKQAEKHAGSTFDSSAAKGASLSNTAITTAATSKNVERKPAAMAWLGWIAAVAAAAFFAIKYWSKIKSFWSIVKSFLNIK